MADFHQTGMISTLHRLGRVDLDSLETQLEAFSITFGGVELALAIAFGLGARDSAKQMIERRLKREPEQKEEDFSHL